MRFFKKRIPINQLYLVEPLIFVDKIKIDRYTFTCESRKGEYQNGNSSKT